MCNFNKHLKKNKFLVFFTIFLFLYTSCSSPKKSEKIAKASNDEPCVGCPPSKKSESKESQEQGAQNQVQPAQKKAAPTQEELNQAADKLEKLFPALEEAIEEIPRDTFDPQAVVDEVGNDPELLFKWIRDNTYFVPYQGSLRGPIGVLMDRLGNSLDRALLLYELLQLAGHEAQLARGTLREEQSKELLNRVAHVPEGGALKQRDLAPPEMEKFIEEYATQHQLDGKKIREMIDKMSQDQEEIVKKLKDRIAQQTEYISRAVKEFRMKPGPEEENAQFRAIQDHWWVKMEKEGEWLDMDPTLPDAQPGLKLTESENTYEPEELENNLFHLVNIRVIIERWADGNIDEDTVLEHILKASELFGERIVLRHIPMNWPKELNLFEEKDPLNSLIKAAENEKEWLPALAVGSDRITQSSFNDSGKVNESPGKKSSSGGVGGITGGLFRALAGEESEKEEKKKSYLTAEWIEYEVLVPGSSPRRIRRQIFDLLGPAARMEKNIKDLEISESQRLACSLALLGEIDILIQVCYLSTNFYLNLLAQSLNQNKEILLSLFREHDGIKKTGVAALLSNLVPLPDSTYNLALSRQLWSRLKNSIYLDRPNIVNYCKSLRKSLKGEVLQEEGYDIVANEVAVISRSEMESFLVHLEQGVTDTNVESLLLNYFGKPVVNTAEIFHQSSKNNIEWYVIKNSKDLEKQRFEFSRGVSAFIEKDLSEGYIDLVPNKSIPVQDYSIIGWWRINPKNGEVLGMIQPGKGQSLVERIGIFTALTWPFFIYSSLDLQKCLKSGGDPFWCRICALRNGAFAEFGYLSIIFQWQMALAVTFIIWLADETLDIIC